MLVVRKAMTVAPTPIRRRFLPPLERAIFGLLFEFFCFERVAEVGHGGDTGSDEAINAGGGFVEGFSSGAGGLELFVELFGVGLAVGI